MSHETLEMLYGNINKGPNAFFYLPSLWESEDYLEEKADINLVLSDSETSVLIREVRIRVIGRSEVDLSDLIKSLIFMQYSVEGMEIFSYNYKTNSYITHGKDPLPTGARIPIAELVRSNGKLQIKIMVKQSPLPNILQLNTECTTTTLPEERMEVEAGDTPTILGAEESRESLLDFTDPQGIKSILKNKRTKEKKIQEVVDLVNKWRRPWMGYIDETTGLEVKLSLEESAKQIGMSKKSLDDYLLQIRAGKKYGFNFATRGNEGVGILRAFVKKAKASKEQPDNNLLDEDSLFKKKKSKHKTKKVTFETPSGTLSTRSKKITK